MSAVSGPGQELAKELPSKYLPGVGYRDLPEPLPLRKVIGPSVLLLAVSIGSGEFVLWPFITSRMGTGILWIAAVGILTQYFINMEIERYTLATGETAVTGFTRLWNHWSWLFILFTAGAWVWPRMGDRRFDIAGVPPRLGGGVGDEQHSHGARTHGHRHRTDGLARGVPGGREVPDGHGRGHLRVPHPCSVHGLGGRGVGQALRVHDTRPPDLTPAVMLGALAFAGAGGSVNLAQSNWIRDKGLGMGAHIARIESPLTGEPLAVPSIGWMFPTDEKNMKRWRGWWRVANQEQFFFFFFVLGAISIIVLSVLTASTIFGEDVGSGFDFIQLEGEALKEIVAPWFGSFFWITGAVVLFSTNLGVLDHVGRVIADILKINWLSENESWSESKLYFAIVWAEIAIGSLILLFAISQPLLLLVIASSLNGLVMLVYSVLLKMLNRRTMPGPVRIAGVRLGAMVWSVLFFGFFSVILLQDQLSSLFGG